LLANLAVAASNDVIDAGGIDAGPPDELDERVCQQVNRMPLTQAAVAFSDGVRTASTMTASLMMGGGLKRSFG
jgi:hypothetical protein